MDFEFVAAEFAQRLPVSEQVTFMEKGISFVAENVSYTASKGKDQTVPPCHLIGRLLLAHYSTRSIDVFETTTFTPYKSADITYLPLC